jgi:hypothetical protein
MNDDMMMSERWLAGWCAVAADGDEERLVRVLILAIIIILAIIVIITRDSSCIIFWNKATAC